MAFFHFKGSILQGLITSSVLFLGINITQSAPQNKPVEH
jgi:hypothetical protein